MPWVCGAKQGEGAASAGLLPSLSVSWDRAFLLKWRMLQYLAQTYFMQCGRRLEEYFY